MSIKIQSLRCPDCNAALEIEAGRSQCFCNYCGAKISIVNENEFITRTIDEAAIERAKADKEIELAKIKNKHEESFRDTIPILAFLGFFVFALIFTAIMKALGLA